MKGALLLVAAVIALSTLLACNATPQNERGMEGLRNWPWANDGLVNPAAYYQRYRRDEYPSSKPFFQWWYFYFSDFETNKYYFVVYAVDQTWTDPSKQFIKAGMGMVDVDAKSHWGKIEQFPMPSAQFSNYYDLVVENNNTNVYGIKVLDNNTYHLTGSMINPQNNRWCDGSNTDLQCDTEVSWDLTLNRIEGWYGEADLEEISIKLGSGEICWNPYAHDSLVQGQINIGGKVFTFDHSVNYRAYGDMNWGTLFPQGQGPDDIKYPWGWFTVNVPHEDPQEDFSIVVGSGLTNIGFPAGTVMAFFADFRFNSTYRLGAREVRIWDGTVVSNPVVTTSSDGALKSFTVDKKEWATFWDQTQNYSIPLQQTVSVVTTHHSILLEYTTTQAQVNRIPFFDQNFVFSDFEGLGATVHVVVNYTDDAGVTTTLYDFVSNTAGVEYGYRTQTVTK